MSDNKTLRAVADVARSIMMGEALKGDQHKIDKNKNNKIDAQDFEMLRKDKDIKEEKVECSKCNGKGCDHCDNKGYHMEESCGKDHKVKKEDKCPVTGEDECKCEEVEQLDEKTPTRQQVKQAIGIARDKRYAGGNMTGAVKAMNKINKGLAGHPKVSDELRKQNEETEQIDEYKQDESGVTRIKGFRYGASKPEKHAVDTMKGPTRKELEKMDKKKPFKEMLELYAEKGLKSLEEMTMKEEPDQETYEKELAKTKKKATEKKTPEEEAGVAKAYVQACEEVEQLDELSPKTLGSYINKAHKNSHDTASDYHSSEYVQARREDGLSARELDDPDSEHEMKHNERSMKKRQAGIKTATKKLIKKTTNEEVESINERPMTDAEMAKREDIVKGMKKSLKGFKDRYGDKAKQVMYATATKQAMKEDEE